MTRRRARPARGGKGGAEPRLAIALREQRIVDLPLRRYHQQEIATIEGVSQSAVSKTLRRVHERVAKATAEQWRLRQARLALFYGDSVVAMALAYYAFRNTRRPGNYGMS
jgi:hypothetical protein